MKALKTVSTGILLILAFWLGYKFKTSSGNVSARIPEASSDMRQAEYWTCSMHPQIRQPKAGKCPLCGMDLIPVESGSGDKAGRAELKLSEEAEKLAKEAGLGADNIVNTSEKMVKTFIINRQH